jgi:hypothetical protein
MVAVPIGVTVGWLISPAKLNVKLATTNAIVTDTISKIIATTTDLSLFP